MAGGAPPSAACAGGANHHLNPTLEIGCFELKIDTFADRHST